MTNFYKLFKRSTSGQVYYPEVDGIRFLAIALVVMYHIYAFYLTKCTLNFTNDSTNYYWLNALLNHGNKGVEMFFVLSGYILALPFALQYICGGNKVNIKKYYVRRITRLEPPYILALIAIFLLKFVTKVAPLKVLFPSLISSLLYSYQIIYHSHPFLTVVAWSLEIEIQFYIIAPFLFKLLSLDVVPRRTILLLVCLTIMIVQLNIHMPFDSIVQYLQYFIIGILLADLKASKYVPKLINSKIVTAISLALIPSIVYFFPTEERQQYFTIIGYLLTPFAIGFLYFSIFNNEKMKAIFSYKWIPIIGGMCYSIYLTHYTVISIFNKYVVNLPYPNYLTAILAQILIQFIPVLIVGTAYYYFIEKPFMSNKWTEKIMRKN